MFTVHTVVLSAVNHQYYLSSSLTKVPLVQRPVEFLIVLQYMYPKIFTHRSAMLLREISMQEL
jgi:hypothetical protein